MSEIENLKVMTVVGTRPEIIRLSRVIANLDNHYEHYLVHTGQNYDYELSQIFFDDMQIRQPDFFLNASRSSPSATIGAVIASVDELILNVGPDALLVLGDTNSCMAVLPAKRRKIPVFHMEAGNRCFDMRVPEEINRKVVDHLSDINLTYSEIARSHLLREGVPADRILKIGSPLFEVLTHHKRAIDCSDIVNQFNLEPKKYFVVSAHREENIDNDISFHQLINSLNQLAADYRLPIILSTHPRTKKKLDNSSVDLHKLVNIVKPLKFTDYVKLQQRALVVLSDSGTITEESSIMDFAALNIRDTHERHEGMDEAAVMMTGVQYREIRRGIEILLKEMSLGHKHTRAPNDYIVPNVSDKVVRIISSYVSYVHRVVWNDGAHKGIN